MDSANAPVRHRTKPVRVETTRKVVIRDFVIFQVKLALDGLKDVFLAGLSVGALVLDLLAGSGKRPRLFYRVLAASERFDLWLNLSGAITRLESGEDLGDDGLFGASEAGSDSLLGQLEELVRGGEVSPEIKARLDDELKKRKADLKRWAAGEGLQNPPGAGSSPSSPGSEGEGEGEEDSSGGERNPWETGR